MKNLYVLAVLLVAATVSAIAMPKPHVFVQNDGRWPSEVLFSADVPNATLWITTKGMVVDVVSNDAVGATSNSLRYDVIGSKGSFDVRTTTSANAPIVSILTKDRGLAQMRTANTVIVRNMLPGIHLEYVWEGENVRYNVLLDAGKTPPPMLFQVDGSTGVNSSFDGITARTDNGRVEMTDIKSFQGDQSNQVLTTWHSHNGSFGFGVRKYNETKPLIIDPVVRAFALIGNEDDVISSVKRLTDGSIVIGGWTTSTTMMSSATGTIPTARGAKADGFIAILDADLKIVKSWVYIVGSQDEKVRSIAVRPNGQICATGETNSADFPVKGIFGKTKGAAVDGFLVVFAPNLSTHISGLFLAGNKNDLPKCIAVNTNGHVIVVGSTDSDMGLAVSNQGFTDTLAGSTDGFVYVMNSDATAQEFFTYLGGTENDELTGVTCDKDNNVVVCGNTKSQDLYTFPKKILIQVGVEEKTGEPIFEEVGKNAYSVAYGGGTTDVIVGKFTASGEIVYSTYFGGNGADEAVGVIVEDDQDALVAISTSSSDIPVSGSGTTFSGSMDAMVAVISSDGLRSSGAAYLGGTSNDVVGGITKYANNMALIVGTTQSIDFPAFGPGSASIPQQNNKPFIAVLSITELKFATAIEMPMDAFPMSVVTDNYNNAYLAGRLADNASSNLVQGDNDGFVAKWAFGTVTYASPKAPDALCLGKSVSVRWTVEAIDPSHEFFVDFSTDAGATWTQVAANLKTREYSFKVPSTLTLDSRCMFRVRSIHGHEAITPTALSVISTPNITSQPTSVAPCPSTSVTLRVTAEGTANTYQWRKDGLNVNGANTAEYTIPAVQMSDNGSYDVVITNSCQSINSHPAIITISDKPIIDVQPITTTVNEGATVTLSVSARGSNLMYQWLKNGVDLNGSQYTSATLVLSNTVESDEGSYTCRITSDCGSTISDAAMVTVNPASGVDEETQTVSGTVAVHPQPASETVTFVVPAMSSTATLIIRNAQGAEVSRTPVAAHGELVPVTVSAVSMPAGLYSVSIVSDGLVVRSTFVVSR